MKFYNRENELNVLHTLYEQAETSARMTVITGRRRVGKTLLVTEFAKGKKYLYFFVSKKSEVLLCEEYLSEIKNVFTIPVIGKITRFKEIFELLLQLSEKERLTLILDEFQEFYNINTAVYSEIQRLWDLYKQKSKLNLIVVGSIYSLMNKIFKNSKEPLFGRADRVLALKAFNITEVNKILKDYNIDSPKTLFHYYLFTGNLPKYIDMLVTNELFNYEDMIDFIFANNSPFIEEGKYLLIEEFGKEYGIYFSILELIANGKTSRNEIESILGKNIGGYLKRLENDYDLIEKIKPINAKPDSRIQKYRIIDNFLNFWFRFIYHNKSAVEAANYNYIKKIIERDFSTYSGKPLEDFYKRLFAESGKYNNIGSYWEKGNQNEIDLVAINDLDKKIVLAEIKLNKDRIRPALLEQKARKLLSAYKNYNREFLALDIEDAVKFLN